MVADAAGFAKKRSNMFYNFKLHKPPALGIIAMISLSLRIETRI